MAPTPILHYHYIDSGVHSLISNADNNLSKMLLRRQVFVRLLRLTEWKYGVDDRAELDGCNQPVQSFEPEK